jgi:hypothetical protein
MSSVFDSDTTLRKNAKEYARFCRIHALFLVDGLEHWRTALKERGFAEIEVGVKVAAATDYIRRIGESSSQRMEA